MTATLAQLKAGSTSVIDIVTVWHVDDVGAEHVYRFATEPLAPPITYLGGFVPGTLLDVQWTRGGTDVQGEWQTGTLHVVLSDLNSTMRRWLDNDNQIVLRNVRMAYDQVTMASYLARSTPTRLWFGVIDTVRVGSDGRTFEIDGVDILTPLLDVSWPRTVIDSTHWSGADIELGRPEPIVYGTWGDADPTYGGEWEVIHTGATSSLGAGWELMLVCRGEVDSIDSIWIDGVDQSANVGVSIDLRAPGYTNWPEANPYVDRGGRRYTAFHVGHSLKDAVKAGTSKITVALTSGQTTTNKTLDQLAHFLDNYVFQEYGTGAYYDETDSELLTSLYTRDGNSFDDSLAEQDSVGAWGLQAPTTLRDIIRAAALAGDATLTHIATGSIAAYCDEAGAVGYLAVGPSDNAEGADDIIADSVRSEKRKKCNILPYTYGRWIGGSPMSGEVTEEDSASIAADGNLYADPVDLWMLRDSTSAEWVMGRRMERAVADVNDIAVSVGGCHGLTGGSPIALGLPMQLTSRDAVGTIVGYGDYIVSTGPSRFWRLSEQPEIGTTVALDAMGNGNGTYVGSPQLGASGPTGDGSTGMVFDGSDDQVTFSALTLTSTVTFEFWIRPDTSQAGTYGTIIELSGSAGIYWKDDVAKISVNYGADNLNATALENGVWYHIVISISAGTGTFYVNGVADGTFSAYAGYNAVSLGYHSAIGNFRLKSELKDVTIYAGAALAGFQALAAYNARVLDAIDSGWSSVTARCDGMSYDMRSRRLDLRASERVTLSA